MKKILFSYFLYYNKVITIFIFIVLLLINPLSVIYCDNTVIQTNVSDSEDIKDPSKINWKGLGLWGLLSVIGIILELLRRFLVGDWGWNSDSSISSDSSSISGDSRSATPELTSAGLSSVSRYGPLANSICQYLIPRNGETYVVTDLAIMRQLNSQYGFNVFDLETQAKVAAEIYRTLLNFGSTTQGALFKANLYYGSCEAWNSVTNIVEYQGMSLYDFVDVIRETAREQSLT